MIEKKQLFMSFLLIIFIQGHIPLSSASFQVQIMPHPVYTVDVNQSYNLTVNIQYDIPPQANKDFDPIELWISSPPFMSDRIQLEGKGIYPFELQLVAPSQHGDHSLKIKLHISSSQHLATVMDTALIHYKVVEPILNDWAITKVWITPESPATGDEVIIHTTVTLKNTTYSRERHIAYVGFWLDGRFFSGILFRGDKPTSPHFSTQDIVTRNTWTAEEGYHKIRVLIYDVNNFPDPNPYDNEKVIFFLGSARPKSAHLFYHRALQDKQFFVFYFSLMAISIIFLAKLWRS